MNLQFHAIIVLICSRKARNCTSLLMCFNIIVYLKSSRKPITPLPLTVLRITSSITCDIRCISSFEWFCLKMLILSTSKYIKANLQPASLLILSMQYFLMSGSCSVNVITLCLSDLLLSSSSFNFNCMLSFFMTSTSDICNSRYSDCLLSEIYFFSMSTRTHLYVLSTLRMRMHMHFLMSDFKLLATSMKSSRST